MRSLFVLLACVACALAQSTGAPSQRPDCGNTPIAPDESRIVGGKVAIPYSWPWQVEMCFDYGNGCDLRCGGTIIDKNWIMSAAHCVDGYTDQPQYFGIKVGTFDYRDNNETLEVVFKVTEIHMNPKYGTPHQFSHDMSLLKVDGEIQFNNHVQPVCIPKNVNNLIHVGKSAYVTGWGTTSEGGEVSNKLQQVLVPFLDMKDCKAEYKGQIDNTMECAGRVGVDSCQGDSGGPLVTKHNDTGKWFQAGIVSWGQGCAEQGYAGVYGRPSSMCDFLKATLGYEICQ